MGHTDATSDLSWDHAALKQVGCSHSALLYGFVITLTDTASMRQSSAIVLYRNKPIHASVSHQPPASGRVRQQAIARASLSTVAAVLARRGVCDVVRCW